MFSCLLGTVEERDGFIEAFWRRRDPVPGTPVNEFREEHYRRFEYANSELRGEAFSPGWKTDRGRMHIILGSPRSIETFDNYNNLYTSQLWFYQGDQGKNVPSFFYLLFSKKLDAVQYRLFIPGADVPGDLIRGSTRSFPERNMEQLLRISPELARAALAVDAAEPVDIMGGTVSLGSQVAMARIEASPRYAVRTDYLDTWERYGSRVSSEYSFNFVPSEDSFAVLVGPDRTPYLHFSIELGPGEPPDGYEPRRVAFVHDTRRQSGGTGPERPPGSRGREGGLRPTDEGAVGRDPGLDVRLPGRRPAGAGATTR